MCIFILCPTQKSYKFFDERPENQVKKAASPEPEDLDDGDSKSGQKCPFGQRARNDQILGFDVNRKLEELFFEIQRLDSTVRIIRTESFRGTDEIRKIDDLFRIERKTLKI